MACDAPVFKRICYSIWTAKNAVLADKYGIVMGSSATLEPLLRNNLGELFIRISNNGLRIHPDKKLYIITKDDSGRSVSYVD